MVEDVAITYEHEAYTDGACRGGNPGAASWAWIVVADLSRKFLVTFGCDLTEMVHAPSSPLKAVLFGNCKHKN